MTRLPDDAASTRSESEETQEALDGHLETAVPATIEVDLAPATENVAAFGQAPRLHPAPGRCIIRIVPRVLEATSEHGQVIAALDGRYQNQPMVGSLQAIGDPTNEKERQIATWATEQAENGALFVFSMFGAGSPYWDDEMRKMIPLGYDFRWLQGLRLFDINQLSATVENTGAYGEARAEKMVPLRLAELEEVQ